MEGKEFISVAGSGAGRTASAVNRRAYDPGHLRNEQGLEDEGQVQKTAQAALQRLTPSSQTLAFLWLWRLRNALAPNLEKRYSFPMTGHLSEALGASQGKRRRIGPVVDRLNAAQAAAQSFFLVSRGRPGFCA